MTESQHVSSSTPIMAKPDSLPENLSELWELSAAELNEAYHSSAVLRWIGMFFYVIEFVPCMLWAIPLLCPMAYVLRNVRSIKAQKRIIHIAVFWEICGAITFIAHLGLFFISSLENAHMICFSLFMNCLILMPMLFIHRYVKKKHVFSDKPYSHEEIKYVMDIRKQSSLESIVKPAPYSYGKLAKTAMFLCFLWYFLALFNAASVEATLDFLKDRKKSEIIPPETIAYAEECVKQGDEASASGDYAKAKDYYEQAASVGHPEAKLCLGVIYAEGLAGTVDNVKAFSLLTEDGVIDSPIAKYYVGLIYYSGDGIQQDYKKTAHYLQASAEAGYNPAKYVVGLMYYSGEGFQQDFKKAAQYLQESAQGGYKPAQDYWGYENGTMPDYGRPLDEVLEQLWLSEHPESAPPQSNKAPYEKTSKNR